MFANRYVDNFIQDLIIQKLNSVMHVFHKLHP